MRSIALGQEKKGGKGGKEEPCNGSPSLIRLIASVIKKKKEKKGTRASTPTPVKGG